MSAPRPTGRRWSVRRRRRSATCRARSRRLHGEPLHGRRHARVLGPPRRAAPARGSSCSSARRTPVPPTSRTSSSPAAGRLGARRGLVDSLGGAGDGLSDVGAVVGATAPEHIARLRELMPRAPFLLPGVGAQGGRVEDLAAGVRAGTGRRARDRVALDRPRPRAGRGAGPAARARGRAPARAGVGARGLSRALGVGLGERPAPYPAPTHARSSSATRGGWPRSRSSR